MMTDQEQDPNQDDTQDEKKPDRNMLMIWALKNAKEGKKIIVGGQYQTNGAASPVVVAEPKKPAKTKIKKTKQRIFTKIPELDDIKDIAPTANWSGRNILYEACVTEQANIIFQTLQSQGAPKELLDHLVALREAMKSGDFTETKNALSTLAENWGGNTDASNRPNYHLLRSFIRLVYETYPLG